MNLNELSGSLILIGAGIMVISGGITSYANILMKMDAVQLRNVSNPPFIMSRRYVMMAVSLYIIGGLADIVSLGLVPLSLRACASCLTIPFNAVFAKITLNESMTQSQMLGSAITVFGCVVAMLFASHQEPVDPSAVDYGSNESDVISRLLSRRVADFTMITLPVNFLCLYIVWRNLPKAGTHVAIPTYRSALHRLTVLASATLATSYQTAWTNLLIKCIAVIAQETFTSLVLWLFVGLMILSGLCQMMLMSSIMRLFEAVVIVPPYQIAITVWLIVFSAVVFNEHVANLAGFVLALLFSFIGILLVALPQRRPQVAGDREPLVTLPQ